MQAPLGGEGDDHDEGADRRHDPRRRELQRRRLRFPAAIRHSPPLARPPRHLTTGTVSYLQLQVRRAARRGSGRGRQWCGVE